MPSRSCGSTVLRRARGFQDEDVKDVYKSTNAIMFLGTPHRGSDHASLGDTVRRIVSAVGFDTHGQILQALQPGGEILELAREEFCELWREKGFTVRTFQESQGIAGVRGLNGKVRSKPLYRNSQANFH